MRATRESAPAVVASGGRSQDHTGRGSESENKVYPASEQPSLFSAPPTLGTARKADPPTSKAAAESLTGPVLGAMQEEVLAALVDRGGHGTLDDVVGITGREKGATSRRLTDLERGGLIRRTDRTRPGRSGRAQIVWLVTHG